MTSPAVETVRTVPLIVENSFNRGYIPMDIDSSNSGFPFEREPDREGHFRSQLDDIAKRHPELAEHLGSFSRRRQSSGEDTEDFHRRFDRPFASGHFDRFAGFPFDRDNFDPEQYAQQFYQQQPETHQQPGYQHQASYPPQEQPREPPQERNLHQSNTADLGQRQEPVNDRNQRSMSAPPPEKAQRFTSSINIPVNQPGGEEETANMAQTDKTTERIIPIHIEGRDEPVLPKTAPQPERIFGQRPEHFTQFVGREPRQYDKWQRPAFEQQQTVPPFYQQTQQQAPPQPAKEEIPIPVQREAPPQPQPQPAPPQPSKPKTPIEQIQAIQKDVSELLGQVEGFGGKPKDKQYLYLDEMLTRNLLKLDNVDTQGQDSIRSARKEAIKCIEKAIAVLEAKAAANVEPAQPEKMEVEEKLDDAPKELEQTETQQTTEIEPQQMEFSPVTPSTEETKTSDEPVVENRAVLVVTEPKPEEEKSEPMEVKEEQPVEEIKPEPPVESEVQESNLAVADAIKKFEGKEEEKPEETKESSPQVQTEQEKEVKTEDKKEKKKGKKKAEKKEK